MLTKVTIKNFKSIIDTTIEFKENLFVLAGQNEAGKSSILEALKTFENKHFDSENLNFEEVSKGNKTQHISCTFTIDRSDFWDDIESSFQSFIDVVFQKTEKKINIFERLKLNKIKEYTITRLFDYSSDIPEIITTIDEQFIILLKQATNVKPILKTEEKEQVDTSLLVDFEKYSEEIISSIWSYSPEIILFNDFTDLLPDEILIEDLEQDNESAQGYNAVICIESLLNENFSNLSKKNIAQKNSAVEIESQTISASFQNDWKQKIDDNKDVKIKFFIENDSTGKCKVSFYLETKDNVFLEPRKRSKGMIWFLSLWLELKAREKDSNLILLFDEPGLHLHVKANQDMLSLFKKLTAKDNQIIYSTHLPSLIDTEKLHNIGLVINSIDKGTIVEGLTTSKINSVNKRDALQPVAEAMGLEPLKDFSILSQKNVLLEGLSDFWYLNAMSKILNKKIDYKFVPGVGIKSSKMFPLISFCIGYGLDWILLMDNGVIPQTTRKELKENLFNNNETETNKKIHLIDYKEIEDAFSIDDLKLIDSKIKGDTTKSPSEIIGAKRKILFSKNFYSLVENNKIKKEHLSQKAIQNFEKIFEIISSALPSSKLK